MLKGLLTSLDNQKHPQPKIRCERKIQSLSQLFFMSTACIRRNRRSRFSIINQHPRTSTELIHSLLRLCLGMRPTIPNRFLIEAKRRYEIAIPQIWDHKRPPFLSCFFTFNKQRQFLHSQNKRIQKLGSPWLRSLLGWKQWKFRTVPNDWQQGVRNTKHDQSNICWRKSKHNHCLMCKNNNQRYHFANSIFRANEPNLLLIRLSVHLFLSQHNISQTYVPREKSTLERANQLLKHRSNTLNQNFHQDFITNVAQAYRSELLHTHRIVLFRNENYWSYLKYIPIK